MMNYWFTSDWHLGHYNIIRYCNRPFKSADEMDKTILTNYNSVVRPGDIVFHLGDFCFRSDPRKYFKQINPKQIHIIWGNHDRDAKKFKHCFASYESLRDIKIDGIPVTLCHYRMDVWNKSHYNAGHLYGHSHGRLKYNGGKKFDCGVDTNNFFPYSWQQVKEKMATLDDNFNLIKE